jgi:hypothetical protein
MSHHDDRQVYAETLKEPRNPIRVLPFRIRLLARSFPRTRRRGRSARIPTVVCLRDIVSGWPLGIAILAVVKAVLGTSRNAERDTKAIALYVGAATKWARIELHFTHVWTP